jgi:hypothetical protein
MNAEDEGGGDDGVRSSSGKGLHPAAAPRNGAGKGARAVDAGRNDTPAAAMAAGASAVRAGRPGSSRFLRFAVHPKLSCLPHAEGAEDAEKRMTIAFSASSISPRPSA